MNLRNLQIYDDEASNKADILDGLNELELIIDNNYSSLGDREIAIEFNIRSRLGEPKKYIVVYNNPSLNHNPYCFILENINGQRILADKTVLSSFEALSNFERRRNTHKVLTDGFKNLPKHRFLSDPQIIEARELAQKYDDELEYP